MALSKSILIIDDDISALHSLGSFFEDEGYRVSCASDGAMGLKLFFKHPVDLVLTDLRMPKKDGIEVMKTIRSKSPQTPMVVVSGAGKKEDVIRVLRMGAKDYITKPIEDLNVVGHTIAQVIEHKRLSDENAAYRKKLEKSENKYRTITENIAEGVFTVDEFENFTYANQAFSNMIGYSNADILGKNLKDVSTQDSFEIIQSQTQNRRNGQTDRYVIEMINRTGTSVHVELACSPINDTNNECQGATVVARDITQIMALRKTHQDFVRAQKTPSEGVTPICANCKSIRVKKGHWVPVEEYFGKILFSHGICTACCDKLYPEFDLSSLDKK